MTSFDLKCLLLVQKGRLNTVVSLGAATRASHPRDLVHRHEYREHVSLLLLISKALEQTMGLA